MKHGEIVENACGYEIDVDEGSTVRELPMMIAINGKFTSQRLTGVQRVAHELTYALSLLLHGHESAILFVPRDHLDDEVSPWISRRVVPR